MFAPAISTAKHFSCVYLSRGADISAASTNRLPLISDGYRKLLIRIFRVPCSCIGNQFTFQFKGFLISQLLRAFFATYPECSSVAASSLMGLATGSWSHDLSPPGRQKPVVAGNGEALVQSGTRMNEALVLFSGSCLQHRHGADEKPGGRRHFPERPLLYLWRLQRKYGAFSLPAASLHDWLLVFVVFKFHLSC